MPVSTLTIERSEGPGRVKKTRRFSVRLLGFLTADSLWESGSGDEVRSAWIGYLGTDSETQAFTANFRGGHKARSDRHTFQILKKAPYRWSSQRVPGGVVTTAYLPDLFDLEPADPAPARVQFVFAPPRWWVELQAEALAAEFGEDAREAARAALFAAYLDRRTPLPVLGELAFHLELYRAALETDWVYPPRPSLNSGYSYGPLYVEGAEACGFDQVLAISADQTKVTDFLVHQTELYQPSKETIRGTTRFSPDRWLLPDPDPSAAGHQLRLALA